MTDLERIAWLKRDKPRGWQYTVKEICNKLWKESGRADEFDGANRFELTRRHRDSRYPLSDFLNPGVEL